MSTRFGTCFSFGMHFKVFVSLHKILCAMEVGFSWGELRTAFEEIMFAKKVFVEKTAVWMLMKGSKLAYVVSVNEISNIVITTSSGRRLTVFRTFLRELARI